MKNVKTEIIMEATGKLQEEVEAELEIEDPDMEEALAALTPDNGVVLSREEIFELGRKDKEDDQD